MKQVCQQCKFQFHLTSQRFFCCNQSQVVCSTCRRKPCTKCKKPRTMQIIIPKCSKCRSRLYQNDLLIENTCGRYYCSKCLSELFKNAYFKVTVEKCYEGQGLELVVRLYCGHEFLYEELVRFFQHFCLSCGREYDTTLDYELNDGVKLCFLCYRSLHKFLLEQLIKCEFCQIVIKNSSYASILDNSEMAICQKCTKESQISENLISESRKKQEKQPFDNVFQQKKTIIQEKKEFAKSPIEPPIEQVKQIPPKGSIAQVYQKQQQKSPSMPKSPLSKLLKKPSISQLKQKQQKRTNNNKSNSISVTSRFSNNFEQIDQEITESLGLPHDFKLKKHLSNETYVENFLIEIPQNNPQSFVKCKKCCGLTEEKTAFNLYDFDEEMNKSRATIISFNQNGSISSINKKESGYFICRVCYLKSSQRQKSILNASTSTRPKSNMSSRPSKLQETTSSMDYLKPGKSSRKQMRSPSPSPNKQYSLTGSKESFSLKQTKSSLLSPSSSIKNPHPSSYQRHPMSRETTSQSIPPKSMKCDKCRNVRKSLIATIQGYYCDDCYYGKGLHSDPFLR